MAKKKRRIVEEPEEEYEFTPTEFNEREFILKDVYGTRVFAVVMVLGLIVGVIGAVLCNHVDQYGWVVATLISFAVCAAMSKILALMGFRPDMLEPKSMLGNYLIFLMLALGVCVVGINPPFTEIL
ncbi:MAG: hypothetical protein IJ026_03925 [Candidatus Methanomethylophilaceae archaeon]|nr:hypothetical protein [Candidatus Methanomethylophilaceae archaeon]